MILSGEDECQIKTKINIQDLFNDAKYRKTYIKTCAPMVRYSKLQFRKLVRKYGAQLCFTPMIMADSFCKSFKARFNEFSTDFGDTPLIVQFAAKNAIEYLSAAEMIYPYADGVDLNCGCPQRWAIATGYGCALLNDPELMKDLTSTIKRNIPGDFSISVKLRIQKPLNKTINLCRQLEKCGVSFITVHGRTPTQKISERSNVESLNEIRQSISIPFIANGDVKSLKDADRLFEQINCDGVMSARGILSNPALYHGHQTTPMECVQDWTNLTYAAGNNVTFQCLHHHLTFMMEKMMHRKMRVEFNNYTKKEQVYNFLQEKFNVVPQHIEPCEPCLLCEYDETKHKNRTKPISSDDHNLIYDAEKTQGKYFLERINGSDEKICDCGLDFMETSLFDT